MDDTTLDRVFARNAAERAVLRRKHLVVVGLGSAGSALAIMGARAGIGRFTLIDPDVLDPENIGRHMCDLGYLGQSKAAAVADLIRRIHPRADVQAHAADWRVFDRETLGRTLDADCILLGATDSFECQSLINLLSLETGTAAMYAACWGDAAVGEILCVRPNLTPCYECYARFRRETLPLPPADPRRYADLDFDATRTGAQTGLWPNILVICGIAFQLLLSMFDPARPAAPFLNEGRALFLVNVSDFDSLLQPWAVTRGDVQKGCSVCDPALLDELQVEASPEEL